MILTVTPNPSLDLLYEAGRLVWDDANRVPEPRRRPGGQGINVARAAIALGAAAQAVTLLGGSTGEELTAVLEAEGTPLLAAPTAEPTRLFIAIREHRTGRSMLLNSPGPARTEADAVLLAGVIRDALSATRPTWVASCGSLPPGFPTGFHASVGQLATAAGSRFVPDCDGEALRLAAPAAGLLVPNRHEAARLLGEAGTDFDDVRAAADAALRLGRTFDVHHTAITLGAAGAVLTDGVGVWHAAPPRLAGTAVGAGDAFLASLLIDLDTLPPAEALRRATAAASAVLGSGGTDLLDTALVAELLEKTEVRQIRPA